MTLLRSPSDRTERARHGRRARRWRNRLAWTGLVVIVVAAVMWALKLIGEAQHEGESGQGGPGESSAVPTPHGPAGPWELRFNDEFAGQAVDWNRWADETSAESDGGHGNKPNQQLEWNHAQNCAVNGGVLRMTAKPDSIRSPSGTTYNWSSCLLSSSPSYAFRYGYIETRAKLPAESGFWASFWTWQSHENNIPTETDVYEFYSNNQEQLHLTQRSGEGGGCVLDSLSFDPTRGFHTYGADIAPDGTDFYIDGRRVCSAAGTSTGPTNIILSLFVYARIPPISGTIGTTEVDYVRAWERR